MPPKADPYATPFHRRIDALLCVFSLTLAALAAPWDVRIAVALSAAGLAALHAGRGVVPVRVRRVLADIALLSPLAVRVLS